MVAGRQKTRPLTRKLYPGRRADQEFQMIETDRSGEMTFFDSQMIPTGTKLDRYEIRSKIGAGGMGEVYRARDEKLNRDVAIKVLPAALSQDTDRLRRFEQEAQAAGALNHPNILAVHDVGVHDGAPYIVSELLEGEELREQLNDGSLPQRKALDYAQQIAQGLAAAHERGITHRDLRSQEARLR